MSLSTAQADLGAKKTLYETVFRTPDYFCYDPDEQKLWGWHSGERGYIPLEANDQGWLWSVELEAWLGLWAGVYQQEEATWVRLFDPAGQLIPTEAEYERQRAEAAEAELARLQTELEKLKKQ